MATPIELVTAAIEPDHGRAAAAPAAQPRKGMQLAKKIGAVTAVLVALPALLNSAVDLYRVVAKVPSSLQDETNEELFKQHFGELPLVAQKIAIKESNAVVDMVFEVYSGGDIFVTYGGTPQWFRAKAPLPRMANLFFISSANAQAAAVRPAQGTSATGSVVRPQVTIDLDRVRSQRSSAIAVTTPPPANSSTIERAYLVAETRDEHSGLSPSTGSYTKVFRAEPGYRIARHEFQLSSANEAVVNSIKPSPDGQSISVNYTIKSGPAFDRWRGWIKGTLQTAQVKIAN